MKGGTGPVAILLAVVLMAGLDGALGQRIRGKTMLGLGCPRCVKVCGINFTKPGAQPMNVHYEALSLLMARDDACELLKGYQRDFPNIQINEVDGRQIYGAMKQYHEMSELFMLSALLERKSTALDIVEMNTGWTPALSPHLLPLDDLRPMMDDLIITSEVGPEPRIYGIPYYHKKVIVYHRADLLEKYGYKYPDESWEQFEAVWGDIVAKERKAEYSTPC